jgi:predicted hotdog family 3-hydroxylacyl-ACP dehydratase
MKNFEKIVEYIPQRPPFVMVDKIVSVSDQETITSFDIHADNILCEKGVLYEAGLIENIAQTVAAGAGYKKKKEKSDPEIGFIGAVKNLKITSLPKIGNTIKTVVKLITRFENALVVEGTVFDKDITIAKCQMNIFIINNLNF